MKKIVAAGLTAIAAAITLGGWQPAQAETRCWRNGNHMQCQNVQPRPDYNRYNRSPHNYNYNYRTYRPYNNYNYSYNYRTYRPYNNYSYNYRTYSPYNNYSYNYRTYRPYNNYSYGYNSGLARAINQIYQQELGRNVDGEGLRHYINQYYNGWSLWQIRRDIANSQEAYNRRVGYY
jgi:hypothetical protein